MQNPRERENERARANIDIFYELFDNLFSCTRNTLFFVYVFMVEELLLLLVSNLSFARFIWHCDFDCYFFSFLCLHLFSSLLLLFRAARYDRCGNLSQQDANLLFGIKKRNNTKTMCREFI